MTAALPPLRGRRITWTTILGLLLVPLTVAGLFIWGLWKPTERLDQVTAAVVNLDEPVEVDGQLLPLGRLLAGQLVDGPSETVNYTWVLTDEEDAEAGIADGSYSTSITIPENFSAAATSASSGPDALEQATITIAQSDRGRLLDTALSGIVTQTATQLLNEQLGEQFVGNVFVGMAGIADGVATAADGAHALAHGGDELASGAHSLADGTSQLSEGVQQLSAGAAGLSGGVSELSAGAAQLSSGAAAAASGGQTLAEQTAQYVGGVNEALSGLQAGAGAAVAPLTQMRDAVRAGLLPLPEGQSPEAVAAGLDELITQLEGASVDSAGSPITQLKDGGSALADGAAQSAAGQQQLASGLAGLTSGIDGLSSGAAELSSGISGLAAQTPDLASGAAELASGADAAALGAQDLADGLDTAVQQIPKYSEAERTALAQATTRPVQAEGASDSLFGDSGVPLFAGIALWGGALATFLVLSPLWRRTREAARGVLAITLRSAVPAIALGAAQGALAGLILPIALGYDLASGAAFFGFSVLAGVAFSLIVQGLSARLGGFGRFVAFAALVVAFVVGIVSTVPGALTVISDASPIGAAFSGFQAIAADASGVGAGIAFLTLWGLFGFVLTAWSVARERRTASASVTG